jgi:predicted type IV restriction endonuclease
MSLLAAIQRIRERLTNGTACPNEQAITQTIVLPVLNALGWDRDDPEVVWPEYSCAPRRVDLALCNPRTQPAVFVEVKQPGSVDEADRQLFEYAFHQGVPMAVLTDGQTWSFYLPAEQGSYDQRRFYKLDLLERSPDESVEKFVRYLEFQRIVSGIAFDDARADYRSRRGQTLANQTIPIAWKELVDAEDEMLVSLLSGEVEKRCGFKPVREELIEFLNALRTVARPQTPAPPNPIRPTGRTAQPREPEVWNGSYFLYKGTRNTARSAKEVVVGILRSLAKDKPDLFEQCYRHPDNRQRRRTYIGRSPAELYSEDRPDLHKQHVEIAPGWFLMTNFNNQVKESIIHMACNVAGVKVGEQLSYQL